MKRQTAPWVRKAEEDWVGANAFAHERPPLRAPTCFHCQEATEKYLKALLNESGAAVPKTHDLTDVLDLLLPHDPTLAPLRRALISLSRYTIDCLYPGQRTTQRQMAAALRHAGRVREEVRLRLNLLS
jgi:HEPN domain-containing protein